MTYTRLIALRLACVVTVGTIFFLGWTFLGLAGMRALANQREIVPSSVRCLKVQFLNWVMSGLIAGVSGILLANPARIQSLCYSLVHGYSGNRCRWPFFAIAGVSRLPAAWRSATMGTPLSSVAACSTLTPPSCLLSSP